VKRRNTGAMLVAAIGLALSGYSWWTYQTAMGFDLAGAPSTASLIHPENLVLKTLVHRLDIHPGIAAGYLQWLIIAMFALGVLLTAWGLYEALVRDN